MRLQEEANKRQERLRMIQLAEEQELERKSLRKLARDKEERLKMLQKSE